MSSEVYYPAANQMRLSAALHLNVSCCESFRAVWHFLLFPKHHLCSQNFVPVLYPYQITLKLPLTQNILAVDK